LSLTRLDADGAAVGELVRVAHEVQQCLAQAHLIGLHRSDSGVALNRNFVGVFGRQRFDRLDDIGDKRRKREEINAA
jgi:hypothetical protein